MKRNTGLFEAMRCWVLTFTSFHMAVVMSVFTPTVSHAVGSGTSQSVIQNIEKLLKEGRNAEADRAIQSAQSSDGENFRLKFLNCILLSQQATSKKAISCFQQWEQEFPNVPEAHNNIGVLYASMGMQVEARKWFEQGLKQQQTYAALHQNLLDLQAEMSRHAYASALQLDKPKVTTQPKLIMLGRITSVSDQSNPAFSADAPAKAATPLISKPGTPVVPLQSVEVLPTGKPSTVVTPPLTAPPVKTESLAQDPLQESRVREAVQAWASAWREKNVDAYLQSYAPAFNPGSRVSRSAWEEQRRERILSKKEIYLELSKFQIQLSSGNAKATVSFVQRYESGSVVAVSRKTLEMVEDKGRWLIVREFVAGA